MSTFKRYFAPTFCLLVALSYAIWVPASFGGTVTPPPEQPDVNWDFFLAQTKTHFRYTGIMTLVENVKERTNGHFKITLYASGEVPYTGTEAIEICSNNSFQMSDALVANIAGSSQTAPIFTYPFLFPDWDSFRKSLDVVYPFFQQEMAEKNIHTLFFFPDPLQNMFGQGDVIAKWSDMKGRSMRGQNAYMQEFASLVGANSIAITSNEIATAISRGVIDSFVTSPFTVVSDGYSEFIDWVLPITYSTMGSFVLVNQDAWNALPPQYQTILEEEGKAMSEYYFNTFVNEKVKEAIQTIEGNDVTIHGNNQALVDEGRSIIESHYEKWASEAGSYAVSALAEVYKVLGY